MKLMVPGPAETWPEDLHVLACSTLPHYGEKFLGIWHDVSDSLKTIYGTAGDVIMVPGAGTAGTEMALCGFAGKKCIVVRAGTFCDRMAEILKSHGVNVIDIVVEDRLAVSPEAIEEALSKNPDASAVCMVHSETSTGILHPVAEVAEVVRKSNALFVVDAVSSLGSIEFKMDEWGIDICFTASQKSLGCPGGLAMVAFNEKAFDFLTKNKKNISGFYLNPLIWKWHLDNWQWHPYPTSLPTPVFVAMQKALKRLLANGLDKHYRLHERGASAIRKGCEAAGFELYAKNEEFASLSVTALIPPDGLDEEAFRNCVLSEHDIMIAGGFGDLRGKIIRIGHMGPGISEEYVRATLEAVEACARKQGIDCQPGCAVAAGLGK